MYPIHPIYFQFCPFHHFPFCINPTPSPALPWRAIILYSPKIHCFRFHLHLQWVLFVICRKTLSTNYFSGNYMGFRYVLKNPLVVRVITSTTTENTKFSHILIASIIHWFLWHCSPIVLVFHDENNWFCWHCMMSCGSVNVVCYRHERMHRLRLAGYFVSCVVRAYAGHFR